MSPVQTALASVSPPRNTLEGPALGPLHSAPDVYIPLAQREDSAHKDSLPLSALQIHTASGETCGSTLHKSKQGLDDSGYPQVPTTSALPTSEG